MPAVNLENLERRRRVWVARLRVPADVRGIIGKGVLSRSTGERDAHRAAVKAKPILAAWRQRIEAARSGGQTPIEAQKQAVRAEYQKARRDSPDEAQDVLEESIGRLWASLAPQVSAADWAAALHRHGGDRGLAMSSLAPAFGELIDAALNPATPLLEYEEAWGSALRMRTDKQRDEYRRDVKAFGSERTLEGLRSRDVQAWIDERIASGESVATVRRRMSALRNYWDWLRGRDHVPHEGGPFDKPRYPRQTHSSTSGDSRDSFTSADLVRLHGAAVAGKDPQLAALIMLAAYTGARIEELCSLEVSSVVLEASGDGKAALAIRGSKSKAGERTIPVHKDAFTLVRRLLADAQGGNWLVHSASSNKYETRSPPLSKRFGRLKAAQGFGSGLVFHSIRKTVATALHEAGCPEPIAADILGHKLTTMSYGVYSSGTTLRVRREWLEKALAYSFSPQELPT